jgi:hypothetical protein
VNRIVLKDKYLIGFLELPGKEENFVCYFCRVDFQTSFRRHRKIKSLGSVPEEFFAGGFFAGEFFA